MGKGDKKTRRGKIFQGSYGVLRPKKKAGYVPMIAKAEIPKEDSLKIKPEEVLQETPSAEVVQPAKKIAAKKAPAKKAVQAAEPESAEKPARKKKEAS